MTSEEIRIELFKLRGSGINMVQIARSLNPPCSRQAVYQIIERTFISRRIMLAVSEALDLDPRVVFPEYYEKKKTELN